jgi:hypothetical protein
MNGRSCRPQKFVFKDNGFIPAVWPLSLELRLRGRGPAHRAVPLSARPDATVMHRRPTATAKAAIEFARNPLPTVDAILPNQLPQRRHPPTVASGRLSGRPSRCRGHAEAEQVLADVMQQDEGCHEKRDDTPPPKEEGHPCLRPKMPVNAGLAQPCIFPAVNHVVNYADVLMKGDLFRLSLYPTELTKPWRSTLLPYREFETTVTTLCR